MTNRNRKALSVVGHTLVVLIAIAALGVLNKLDERMMENGSGISSEFAYDEFESLLDRLAAARNNLKEGQE